MSRYSEMSAGKRRAWGIGLVLFFLVMCGMIAWSQWYAVHVNVPRYERLQKSKPIGERARAAGHASVSRRV